MRNSLARIIIHRCSRTLFISPLLRYTIWIARCIMSRSVGVSTSSVLRIKKLDLSHSSSILHSYNHKTGTFVIFFIFFLDNHCKLQHWRSKEIKHNEFSWDVRFFRKLTCNTYFIFPMEGWWWWQWQKHLKVSRSYVKRN